jgi:hypothetical protein
LRIKLEERAGFEPAAKNILYVISDICGGVWIKVKGKLKDKKCFL